MATKTLATWALGLSYQSLPVPVHDLAVKGFANWAGCAIGGQGQPAPSAAFEAFAPFVVPTGNSTIFGTSQFVDAQTAALINGISSHADDYDDTHRDNSIHPSGPVLSALLGVAEWRAPVSGQDFLTAYVAGIEAECKLGISVWPEHYNAGWHITSTVGSIGAAVAVGKLIGLDVEHLQQAISIAAVQVTGMQESFGTDTKPFHVGRAAQNGLMAALLAERGFTGSLRGLEAERGWVNVVSTRDNVTELFATLGDVWETTRNTFKPYPCDRIIHGAIDAVIQLRAQALGQNLDLSQVVNITARVHPRAIYLTDNPAPKTGLEAKFSIYHAAAAAILFGEATPAQFTDEAVRNETVIAMREKVHPVGVEGIDSSEAIVSLEFQDGKKLEVHIEHATGSYLNPLTTDQLEVKFIRQVSAIIGEERASNAWTAFLSIANATDVAQLVRSY